jgi:hypothetical protein
VSLSAGNFTAVRALTSVKPWIVTVPLVNFNVAFTVCSWDMAAAPSRKTFAASTDGVEPPPHAAEVATTTIAARSRLTGVPAR